MKWLLTLLASASVAFGAQVVFPRVNTVPVAPSNSPTVYNPTFRTPSGAEINAAQLDSLEDITGNIESRISTLESAPSGGSTNPLTLASGTALVTNSTLRGVTNIVGNTGLVDFNGRALVRLIPSSAFLLIYTNVPSAGTPARSVKVEVLNDLGAVGSVATSTVVRIEGTAFFKTGYNVVGYEWNGSNVIVRFYQEESTGAGATVLSNAPSIYRPSVVGVTASRAVFLNASGNLTNVTSSSPSTEYVHADGTVGTPSGSGDVTAASSFGTDNRLIRSDGTGKGVQASAVSLNDSGDITGVNSIMSAGGDFSGELSAADVTVSGGLTVSGNTVLSGSVAVSLSSNTIAVVGPGGILSTGILGSGLSYNAATRTLTASGGSGIVESNIIVSATNHTIFDLGAANTFLVKMLTNMHWAVSNFANFTGEATIHFWEDTNGTREVINWMASGGRLQTNATAGTMSPTTNASAISVLKIYRVPGTTNIVASWVSKNPLPINGGFTNSLSEAGGGGGGNGLLNNLYAVYEMEQDAATDAPDEVGSHTLTRTGATSFSTTHIEGSRSSSGSGTAYYSVNNTAFNTNGDFSFSAWVNEPGDGEYLLNRFGGTGQNSWGVYYDGAGVFAGGGNHWKVIVRNSADNANYIASSTVNASGAGWHHVLVTWNSATAVMSISVDGETLVPTATTDGLNASTQDLRFAPMSLVDEMAWWVNRVLGQGDATTIYNSGTGLFYSGGGWQN